MTYNHTAADALAIAQMCKECDKYDTGFFVTPKTSDLIVKMAEFWAEHHRFKKGDKIVYADNFDGDELFTVSYTHTETSVAVEPNDIVFPSFEFRLATAEEEAAGHRIDKVNSIKCWSCDSVIELEQLKNNDGFCPECNAEIENDEVQDGTS